MLGYTQFTFIYNVSTRVHTVICEYNLRCVWNIAVSFNYILAITWWMKAVVLVVCYQSGLGVVGVGGERG